MIDFDMLTHAAPFLLWIPFPVVLLVGLWAIMGRIPRRFYEKYPRRLLKRSQMPFAYAWRAQIEREDLPFIEKARNRSVALEIAILFMGYPMSIAFNIQSAVALYRCNRTADMPTMIPPLRNQSSRNPQASRRPGSPR